jgi:hypothetical protein
VLNKRRKEGDGADGVRETQVDMELKGEEGEERYGVQIWDKGAPRGEPNGQRFVKYKRDIRDYNSALHFTSRYIWQAKVEVHVLMLNIMCKDVFASSSEMHSVSVEV